MANFGVKHCLNVNYTKKIIPYKKLPANYISEKH